MNRLTKKDKRFNCGYQLSTYYNKYEENVINKLGKLEDLEEKLGCPIQKIVPLLLAYKQGYVYTKNIKDEFIKETVISQIGLTTNGEWCVVTKRSFIFNENYGKNWWLKKDEQT